MQNKEEKKTTTSLSYRVEVNSIRSNRLLHLSTLAIMPLYILLYIYIILAISYDKFDPPSYFASLINVLLNINIIHIYL